MDRTHLERPFDKRLIRQVTKANGDPVRGPDGNPIDFVRTAHYIRRLNEAFDGEWGFEVVSHSVSNTEVLVVGRLSAGGFDPRQLELSPPLPHRRVLPEGSCRWRSQI